MDEYRRLGRGRREFSKDGSSEELEVKVSSSILLDLLETTLNTTSVLVIGGGGGITESSDADLVKFCTIANCHSGEGVKGSTAAELALYKRDDVVD